MGDQLPAVDLGAGRSAKAIFAGSFHYCAILDNAQVKCWGNNAVGQLGYGDTNARGDAPGEMGDALLALNLGTNRTAVSLALGAASTCAALDDGSVKCWGASNFGGLGYGDKGRRGDGAGEMGDALPALNLGTGRTVKELIAGARISAHDSTTHSSSVGGPATRANSASVTKRIAETTPAKWATPFSLCPSVPEIARRPMSGGKRDGMFVL